MLTANLPALSTWTSSLSAFLSGLKKVVDFFPTTCQWGRGFNWRLFLAQTQGLRATPLVAFVPPLPDTRTFAAAAGDCRSTRRSGPLDAPHPNFKFETSRSVCFQGQCYLSVVTLADCQ
jgi:hypothetical protein